MTLDELLLEKLAKWRPDSARETLDVRHADGGWEVAVTADHVDVVGCRLWEVALRRPGDTSAVDLAARAGHVADRVTGLLEPLRLLEVDAGKNEALLRSEAPARRGEDRFYYEVVLQGDGAVTVRRYQAPPQGEPRRRQVAFSLTHEALAKLVHDLTAV
jgi:hypothetical protein